MEPQRRTPAEEARRRRLGIVMVARLAVALGVLGAVSVLADRRDGPFVLSEHAIRATVLAAFVITGLQAAWLARARRLSGVAGLQLLTDIALVSSLVHFSGGADSLFGFLYLPLTAYAALFFERRGGYLAAAASALAYGAVLWSPGPASASEVSRLAVWAVHTGGLLLVALLAGLLSRELQRADLALVRSSLDLGRLRSLHERTVESLTSGLLTTDPEGRITSFNAEAARITGASPVDVIGLHIDEVIPGAREKVFPESQGGVRRRARMPFQNRRGEGLYLGLAGSVLRDAGGQPFGHVMIFQDVTQVVAMEHELRRTERLAGVGQLAASLAHEIRNPLAAISGSIEMLGSSLEGPAPEAERESLMGIVLRETDRLDVLLRDFLQYARPSPPRVEPVLLEDAVARLLETWEPSRPGRIREEVELEPGIAVLGDADRLHQLFLNLVLNAAQAMPEGGTLGVRSRTVDSPPPQGDAEAGRNDPQEQEQRWAEIEVSDTGPGIPPEALDRIFDPFFTTKKEGSGLGLPTVHRIVEDHGGHLSVESRLGHGTTFRIRLPRAEGTS